MKKLYAFLLFIVMACLIIVPEIKPEREIYTQDVKSEEKEELLVPYYDEEAKLYCVVKIIRKNPAANGEYAYGCELVGIAPVLSYIFDDYEKQLEKED